MSQPPVPGYKPLTLEQLAIEHGYWIKVGGNELDRTGAFERLSLIYQYAIANYNEPGIELLLGAIDSAEAEAKH